MTRVTGYPIVWRVPRVAGARGEILETVAPSTAERALTTRSEVDLTVNHDRTPARRLASTRDGTLRLTPDAVGLRVEFAIPRSPVGRELEAAMAAGQVRGGSFSWSITDGSRHRWHVDRNALGARAPRPFGAGRSKAPRMRSAP